MVGFLEQILLNPGHTDMPVEKLHRIQDGSIWANDSSTLMETTVFKTYHVNL